MGYHCLLWFLTLPLWNINLVFGLNDCPQECLCLSTLVSCSQRNISGLFDQLPSWVETLDLGSNKLKDDFICNLSHLENLSDLKLSKNFFTSIPNVGILKTLRKLSLSHNEIRSVSTDSLAALPALEDLNLNNNDIEKLTSFVFPKNSSLRTLHLTKNRIEIIQSGAFDNLTNLLKLKINKNRLSSLPKHLFQNQKGLNVLELNENQFKKMDQLIFQGLENLDTLRIRGNNLSHLSDAVFFGLKSIKSLQLDRNAISVIAKGWMYGLATMTYFSLSSNMLVDMEQGCWEFNGLLEELDLSKNHLEGIKGHSLQHLSNLKRLKLDNNKISTIAENAFSHTPNLEVLDLSHNQISWTVEDMNGPFQRLVNLHKFSLSNNHIKSISNKAFLGLTMLTSLDLNENNITSLQDHAFDPLQNLKDLHMNTSSLLCDCNLQWLTLWLGRLPQSNSVKAVCAYPTWLRNKPLLHLNRENFTCNDSPKPKILEHPKTQLAIKGGTSHLHCKAVSTSNVRMVFLWKRNNVNITNPIVKESVLVSDENNLKAHSELFIPNITNSDSGKYQCVVSNSFDTTYSHKARITIVILPKFIKRPSNITVKAGETAKLECAASGEPAPQIAWQKDGGNNFPAARERRMHVMPKDYAFFIINSNISDMGVYSCTAQNPAGAIISNATLTVLEAPSFVNAMVNKEVSAGKSVVLECMISGSPKPSLTWLKDGSAIARTERHFFTAEDQLLIIVGAVPSDEGLYECEITNSLGTMKDSTKLRVLPPVSSVVNEEDMKGIIIITVVCCAVGTSIVWVVVIYHTRKRMNTPIPQFTTDSLQLAPLSTEADHPGTHMFTDNISERSSCKDSGTGDSAKRSSLEALPGEEYPSIVEINGVPVYTEAARVPPDEGHRLLSAMDGHGGALYYYQGDPDCVVNFTTSGQGNDSHREDSNRTFPYS